MSIIAFIGLAVLTLIIITALIVCRTIITMRNPNG